MSKHALEDLPKGKNCRLESHCDAARRARPLRSANSSLLGAPADEKPDHAKTACGLLSEEEEDPRLLHQSAKHRPGLSASAHRLLGGGKTEQEPPVCRQAKPKEKAKGRLRPQHLAQCQTLKTSRNWLKKIGVCLLIRPL